MPGKRRNLAAKLLATLWRRFLWAWTLLNEIYVPCRLSPAPKGDLVWLRVYQGNGFSSGKILGLRGCPDWNTTRTKLFAPSKKDGQNLFCRGDPKKSANKWFHSDSSSNSQEEGAYAATTMFGGNKLLFHFVLQGVRPRDLRGSSWPTDSLAIFGLSYFDLRFLVKFANNICACTFCMLAATPPPCRACILFVSLLAHTSSISVKLRPSTRNHSCCSSFAKESRIYKHMNYSRSRRSLPLLRCGHVIMARAFAVARPHNSKLNIFLHRSQIS